MDEPNEVLSEKTGVADCTELRVKPPRTTTDRQKAGRDASPSASAWGCFRACRMRSRRWPDFPHRHRHAFRVRYRSIAAICPLGALETMFGARQIMLQPLLLLLGMVLVIALVGKAFCALDVPRPLAKATLQAG